MQVPQTYRAYQYDNYGPVEKELQLRLAVKRQPIGPKQVRIKVASAAINPIDYVILEVEGQQFTGKTPTTEKPSGIGFDAFTQCGTVADYVTLDEEQVALKPSNLTFDQAASIPLVALTSYQALVEHAKLQKGETVLILGGSSAVGMVGIQLARSIGARVITTTSAKNADFVKGLGAQQTVDYHTEKWVDALENHSVDVIYDCGMEADAWNHDAQLTLKKDTGRFVSLLALAEPVQPAKFGAKNLNFMICDPNAKDLDEITKFVEKGELVPVIDTVYEFEKLLPALAKLRGRHARGKLVIQVNPETPE
ncbi:hypothetical protein BBJ29_010121 [Phytophthora kernoviae]|uniref:Enoyl reductase (ER) domain-containing protein n=1 Tax=Phytophthora kernoviae TaxID=325452 RepID=A0A421FVA2_9STRA|nr:hypothetical protein BBJ29_010121 [Phytophthora kernoviae]